MKKSLRKFTCPCEKGFHAVDPENPVWEYVISTIDALGDEIPVEMAGTSDKYLVPRIFLAFHGLRGEELPDLGFKKI